MEVNAPGTYRFSMPTSKKRVKKSSRRRRPSAPHQLEQFVIQLLEEMGATSTRMPVWMFRQCATDLAAAPPPPGADQLPYEAWLHLLAAAPINIRSGDGVEGVTSVAEMADRAGCSIDEVIADLTEDHLAGDLVWSQEHQAHVVPAPFDEIREAFAAE
ncbi:hypothetical protein ACFXHA_43075 [Nocardia sp. NPDC059240]|uniref:hypothetical protein n=1 Tax=Nocardia sp. NPDC059240 TaxID=3346786 RepID=UPI0036A74C7C